LNSSVPLALPPLAAVVLESTSVPAVSVTVTDTVSRSPSASETLHWAVISQCGFGDPASFTEYESTVGAERPVVVVNEDVPPVAVSPSEAVATARYS
jgi:hypothetical protein